MGIENIFIENTNVAITYFLTSNALIFILLLFTKSFIIKNLKLVAKQTKSIIDDVVLDVVSKIKSFTLLVVSTIVSMNFLVIPQNIQKYANLLIIIILTFEIAKILNHILKKFIAKKFEKNKSAKTLYSAFEKVLSFVIYAIGLILILDNFGVNVSALIAGLGISGIAAALAVQNLLADLFSSIAIYLDKPFEVGDVINLNGQIGVVKSIGLKTTTIQSLVGSEILISNKTITSNSLENLGRIKNRRILFDISVDYKTPTKKLRQVPELIKQVAEQFELVEIFNCNLSSLGEFSIQFNTIVEYKTADYFEFSKLQNDFYLALLETFEKNKINIPYPTYKIIK